MINNVDFNTFNNEIIDKKTAVLDCYTDWCGYCKMLAPILEQLSDEYKGKVEFFGINTDENQDFVKEYQIMSLPTLLFFKNGKIVDKTTGFLPKEKIISILQNKIVV